MNDRRIALTALFSLFLILILALLLENSIKINTNFPAGITINEFMISNKSTVTDEDGDYSDWIELFNSGPSPVNLKEFELSDNSQDPGKWKLPDYILNSGQYIVIFASGKDKQPADNGFFHTSFKLSSDDDAVLLSRNGNVIEEIKISKCDPDVSYGRDIKNNGQWSILKNPTPGYPNTDSGYDDFLSSRKLKDSLVIINEVMPSNRTTLRDEDWDYSDWIEIYNLGDRQIDLSGYGLSDDASDLHKWKFPKIILEPKNYLVIFASGKDKKEKSSNYYHTNFRLNPSSEKLIFSTPQGKIIDVINLSGLSPDISYGRNTENINRWIYFKRPTPGYENNGNGYNAFLGSMETDSSLIISEAAPYNQFLKDEDGEYSDWIEIHNKKDVPINLSEYRLTDNINYPEKWIFPSKTINPDQSLVVFLSGKNKNNASSKFLHTNFKLDRNSEAIFLTDKSGRLVDKLVLEGTPVYASCGKGPNYEGYYFFNNPTPRGKNVNGYEDIADAPVFSNPGGFYNDKVSLKLSSNLSRAIIRYTTDGSIPDINSPAYLAPISITKTTVIRARCFVNGFLPGPIVTNTFFINSDRNLTTVSISTDPSNLWDEDDGIYVKGKGASPNFPYLGANFWKDIEKPIHIELYEPDGSAGFSIDAGIKIYGSYSRAMDQKSFAVYAREKYGKDFIDYQIFKDKPINKFKSIVLRTSGQDANLSKIRDILMTGLAGDMGLDVQAYRQAVLYINGEYWGIYNIREKINEDFIASNHNISNPNNIDLLVANGKPLSGDANHYKALLDFVSNNDMAQKRNYEYVKTQMDVENYMDYIIAEMYFANTDTGNIKFWREKIPDGKWRWIVYDTDWGFFNVKHNSIAFNLDPEGTGVNKYFSTLLIRKLLENPEFKKVFLQRFGRHMNTTFKPERVIAKIDELSKNIEDEMPKQIKRWGSSMVRWRSQINFLKSFAKERPSYIYKYVQEYFHLSEQDMAGLGFYK